MKVECMGCSYISYDDYKDNQNVCDCLDFGEPSCPFHRVVSEEPVLVRPHLYDLTFLKNLADHHWYVYSEERNKFADTGLSIDDYTENGVWKEIRNGIHEEAWEEEMWGDM